MTPAILREAPFRAGNRVPLETFLHGRKPAEVATLRESMADLVEWELAIDHGDTWQAVRGSGKAVATSQHVKVVKEGQRPLGVLPRMSERCQAGGKANGAKQKAALTERIDALVERLRDGIPAKLLKGLSASRMSDYKRHRPNDYQRLLDAMEYGRRRQVAA
jgi:hypothetical protein